jgi:hypothetical protein
MSGRNVISSFILAGAVATTLAFVLLAMSGAASAAPGSSSANPGPNYYATIHQAAQPDRCLSPDCGAKAQLQPRAVRIHRPSRSR